MDTHRLAGGLVPADDVMRVGGRNRLSMFNLEAIVLMKIGVIVCRSGRSHWC